MSTLKERVFISTMAEDAPTLARQFDLGLEIAEFCTAYNMDDNYPATDKKTREAMRSVSRFTFHAPFSELCPAAIDPLVREVTRRRYRQAIELARSYGIEKIVIHAGFIPQGYYPEWCVPQSVDFWKSFLAETEPSVTICLENVMESEADMLSALVGEVDDPRLRLCLDVGHACTRPDARPVEEWIDREAPYLSHVHLHNNDGRVDRHDPLGKGILDMASLIERIEAACPDVTYTIENLRAAESIDWLCAHHYI